MAIIDLIPPPVLTLFSRRLVLPPEDRPVNRFQLRNWLRPDFTDDIEFQWNAGITRDYTEAIPWRTWSTESRIVKRHGLEIKMGEIAPMSAKIPMTELDKIEARKIALRTADGDATQQVRDIVQRDIANMIKGMQARVEFAVSEFFETGTLVIDENGVDMTIDWGRKASRIDTVGNAWSVPGSATPIPDIRGRLELLEDEEGLEPGEVVMVMDRDTYNNYIESDQVRNAANTIRALPFISDGMNQEISRLLKLPEAVIYNATGRDQTGTTRKIMPAGKVFFLPRSEQIGAELWGEPAIADDPRIQLEVNQRSGPVAWMSLEDEPYQKWAHTQAVVLPTLAYPDATAVLDTEP